MNRRRRRTAHDCWLTVSGLGQPLDEPRPVLGIAARIGEQARGRRGEGLELARLDADRLDRRDVSQSTEPLAQQLHEALRLASRRGEPDLHHARLRAPMRERERETANAGLLRG